jgi:hypothetical protein
MGRKKKEKALKDEVVEAKADVKTFDYGDLAIKCKCGRVQLLEKGVQHGIQIILTTREDSFLKLQCDECGAIMELRFLEGEKPAEPVKELKTVEEVKTKETDENIQEESKQESSL